MVILPPCYAELQLQVQIPDSAMQQINILHICSSGLYEPFSFINTNKNSIAWKQSFKVNIPDSDVYIVSEGQHLLTDSAQHFVRIDLKANESGTPVVDILTCDSDGKIINKVESLSWGQVVAS